MDGLRYSHDDPYYRLGPVYTCLYLRACQLVTGTSFFLDILGRFFPNRTRFQLFFPEIGQGLLLHFWGLCTLINPCLCGGEKEKLIF